MKLAVAVALLTVALADTAAAQPRVTLTPASGVAGASVSLKGAGFPKLSRVVVKQRGKKRAAAHTSDRGTFTITAKLSSASRGMVKLVTTSRRRTVVNYFLVSKAPQFLEAREIALRSNRRLREKPYRGTAGTTVNLAG